MLRVSAEDYEPDGMHPEEMARILEIVKPYVDMVDISTGGVVPTPPPELYPGYQLKAAEYIRQQVGLPTIAVGLLTDPHHVEEILCSGRADLTALGRALLRDPYWVLHAARRAGSGLSVAGAVPARLQGAQIKRKRGRQYGKRTPFSFALRIR